MSFTSDNPIQVNQLPISVDFDIKDIESLKWLLEQNYKRTVSAINTKEGSFYLLQELGNFKQWYTRNDTLRNRNVYRFVFDLVGLNGGNIGPGATVSFNHNISNLTNAALIYASCTSVVPELFTVVYPYAKMNATQVVFTNPTANALTQVDFIAEYLKQ